MQVTALPICSSIATAEAAAEQQSSGNHMEDLTEDQTVE